MLKMLDNFGYVILYVTIYILFLMLIVKLLKIVFLDIKYTIFEKDIKGQRLKKIEDLCLENLHLCYDLEIYLFIQHVQQIIWGKKDE